MSLSRTCVECLASKQEAKVKKYTDEAKKNAYLSAAAEILNEESDDINGPLAVSKMNKIFKELFHEVQDFSQEKEQFNKLMLSMEDELRKNITQAEDSLATALLYARTANYIDFGAFKTVEASTLLSLLEESISQSLPQPTYQAFLKDLQKGKRLVYILDNSGEIVVDKLVIELLLKLYPHLSITTIVRGEPVLNDVTLNDAVQVGLTDLVPVIGNGTDLSGTQLSLISAEAKQIIDDADLLIAKGQGNFETLHCCGKNIYYLFLCKCDYFAKLLQVPLLTGMFINDRQLHKTDSHNFIFSPETLDCSK